MTTIHRAAPVRGLLAGSAEYRAHRDEYGPLPAIDRRQIVELVSRAGLRGRGGAGFPTARKLTAVAAGRRRAVVVANGCESEPASAKDLALLTLVPHLVLDGAALAAVAVGADRVVVCVHRGNDHRGVDRGDRLEWEITQRRADPVRFEVARLPRRYVASEESSLVNFINSGDARPLATPPRPYQRGVQRRPTLVDNVETLAHLARIVYHGADRFRSVGLPNDPGTALVTLAGAVARPGVYEIPTGTSLRSVLELGGGVTESLQAALVGGYFGVWVPLPHGYELPLSHDPAGPTGATLGAGPILALPATSCGLAETARVLRYLAEESAGQCGPCRFGLPAIAGDLAALAVGQPDPAAYQRLTGRLGVIAGRGACKHPDGAVRLASSALAVFAQDAEYHLRRRPCAGTRRAPILPLPGRDGRDRSFS
jgi:NADH:ubiquinone oxidoreductase subunit F (NADH-binding)